jgi:FixJ family two-component response regulator
VISVVDDDPSFLKSVGRLLRANGFEARLFSSAEEFLEAGQSDATCLVLDIQLGEISGIELQRNLLRSGSAIPVVFITANDSEAVQRAARDVGCIGYLTKPFPPNALIDAISRTPTAVTN